MRWLQQIMKTSWRAAGFVSSAALCSAAFPGLRLAAQSSSASQIGAPSVATAAEQQFGYNLYKNAMISDDRQRVLNPGSREFDSLFTKKIAGWVEELQRSKVTGIQMDPMGQLYLGTGQDDLARKEFADRLATPGLSLDDRAYTLFFATAIFAEDAKNVSRMQTALGFLKQLDALPASIALTQFQAHRAVAGSYYLAGDSPRGIEQLEHAFSLFPKIPYLMRNVDPFVMLADMLSGQPGGRAKIDSVSKWLLGQLVVPPELIAQDSSYVWMGQGMIDQFKNTLKLTDYLGRPAEAITAQYWWNMPTPATKSKDAPGAYTQALNDGTIKLLEFGDLACGYCQIALGELNELRKTFPPKTDVWYLTISLGAWGAQACNGVEEAGHLKHLYLTRKQYTMPIIVWTGDDQADINGGMQRKSSPTWQSYGISGGPEFVIVDGHGIVRHVSIGYTKHLPIQMRALKFLAAEAEHERASSAPPASAVSATSSGSAPASVSTSVAATLVQ